MFNDLIPIVSPDRKEHSEKKDKKDHYLNVRQSEFSILSADGKKYIGPAKREFIVCKAAVALMIHCPKEQKVLILRQYREPVIHRKSPPYYDIKDAWIYEPIAGVISGEESPAAGIISGEESIIQTAAREAKEEANIDLNIEDIKLEYSLFPSPGISSEVVHFCTCALDSVPSHELRGGLESEHEAIIPAWVSYNDLRRLKAQKGILDAKLFIGMSLLNL